jgi:acyl-coenzyme A thioesterase PaaI-like protein
MFDLLENIGQHLLHGWQHVTRRHLDRLFNLYPPYLGAGIRVVDIDDDFRRVEVAMELKAYNQNYVGTHFGGSLYSMCDPFYMLMALRNLGPNYIVWDKSAYIDFRKPGRGTVRAVFEISAERLDHIRQQAAAQPKVEPRFEADVVDEAGDVVAHVEKVIYVRRK